MGNVLRRGYKQQPPSLEDFQAAFRHRRFGFLTLSVDGRTSREPN
jgi:hypothetical protein